MTAMKYGVYALVAVVFGVVLVGLLPGQISNMATPAQSTLLQGAESAGGGTQGTIVSTPSRYNSSVGNETVTTSKDAAASAATAASGAKADASSRAAAEAVSDPYADLIYYGMMGVGLVVALGVYFLARRMSG